MYVTRHRTGVSRLTSDHQYTDTWYGKRLPRTCCKSFHPTSGQPLFLVMSWQPYDNTGAAYNVSRILNEDGTFNLEQYKAYSPLFLS